MAIVLDGQILMVYQSYRGENLWTFPGGSIEMGETPAEAAVREVKEEVLLDTRVVKLLYQGPRTRGKGMYYCYLGKILQGQAQLGNDPELPVDVRELLEVRWVPLAEVCGHSEVALILDQLL
jgi:8-oxo-dGTP pyrophosphatase MutT (NUDIX family)